MGKQMSCFTDVSHVFQIMNPVTQLRCRGNFYSYNFF